MELKSSDISAASYLRHSFDYGQIVKDEEIIPNTVSGLELLIKTQGPAASNWTLIANELHKYLQPLTAKSKVQIGSSELELTDTQKSKREIGELAARTLTEEQFMFLLETLDYLFTLNEASKNAITSKPLLTSRSIAADLGNTNECDIKAETLYSLLNEFVTSILEAARTINNKLIKVNEQYLDRLSRKTE